MQWAVLAAFVSFALVRPTCSQTISPARSTDATKTASADEPEESWDVIYLADTRVGYARSTLRRLTRDNQTVLRSRNEMHMTIRRFGQQANLEMILETVESDEGVLESFVFEMRNPPAGSLRTVGTRTQRFDGQPELKLKTSVAGRTTNTTIPWERDAKSPTYQDRLLRENPLKPGESRSFKTFLPELSRFSTVKIVANDYRTIKLLDGKHQRALSVRITQSVLPTMPTRAYLDPEGNALKTEMSFAGAAMITYTVTKEVALEKIAGAELDIAVHTLVHVRPIRDAHQTHRAVYRIRMSDDDPAQYLVGGGTQKITRVDSETIDLTVTARPVPRSVRIHKSREEFLKSTRYLQLEDVRVREHAQRAAAGETDPGRMAKQMERYVHDKLTEKNFSTALASAAEVAERLEGDCTEHAVLLAAMLRVMKIPSRIAVGMVYVDRLQSFAGHMWTEALLGEEWIPLDATLGKGGIGAAHIKMAESSFADDAPAPITTFLPLMNALGKMDIRVMKVEE